MAAKRMRALLDIRSSYVEAGSQNAADSRFIMAMAGLLLAIFSFLQQVRRAVVPHRFGGELDGMIPI